jgi:monothiol glutaredoxin
MSEELRQQIDETVKGNKIVIYMKGTPEAPQCGFSSRTAETLKTLNQPITAVNVLEDQKMWGELERYTNWPTVPQVFIKGEFVGGCDIVLELYQRGELQKMVEE